MTFKNTDIVARFERPSGSNDGKIQITGKGHVAIIESTHEYVNYGRLRGCIEFEGAASLHVSFGSECRTESGCDWLRFYKSEADMNSDGSNIPNCYFTGSDFKNKEVQIADNKFWYKWYTDSSSTAWGYKFTVTAGGQTMSKGQRASLYTALAAYDSASKVAASIAPSIAPIVFTKSTCEVLTKATEKTIGLARQQALSVLTHVMQNQHLFTEEEMPCMGRFHGLRDVLARSQLLTDKHDIGNCRSTSALIGLFASLKHQAVNTTSWSGKGRISAMPVFDRSASFFSLQPLAGTDAAAIVAAEREAAETAAAEAAAARAAIQEAADAEVEGAEAEASGSELRTDALALFAKADTNNDGNLSKKEIKKQIQADETLRQRLSVTSYKAFFAEIDTDGELSAVST